MTSVSAGNEWSNRKGPGKYPAASSIQKAGHEMKVNPPAVLAKTKRRKGKKAAESQRRAIMLSKARRGE